MLSILKTSDADGSIEYVCGLGSDVHGLWRLGLLPGRYKVIFKDDVTNLSKESYWAFQVYQNALSEESGSVIQISNKDESYTDIDAIMQKAKVISGIVKDSEGNPVDGIYADLAVFNPASKAWESSLAVKTREGGKYALHVGSGTYRLSFFDDSQKYEVEYWNDKRTENDASNLIISDNSIEISPVLDIRGEKSVFNSPKKSKKAKKAQLKKAKKSAIKKASNKKPAVAKKSPSKKSSPKKKPASKKPKKK
jgi:hypothetical protein